MKRKPSTRKRVEPGIVESESRYRFVVDNIRQVIFQTDARGQWTFLNAAWTDITGFEIEESLGTSFLHYVHPDDRQRHAEIFQPLVENRSDCFGHVARYVTRAGGYCWLEVFAQVVMDGQTVRGMFGTLTDITERRRAEEELTTTRARLEHLLTSSPAVILSTHVSLDFTITFVSDNVTRLLGYRVDDILHEPGFWRSALHPEDAPAAIRAMVELVGRSGDTAQSSCQYRLRHADGGYRWIHDQRRLVCDAAGDPMELVGSWVDVTEFRRRDEQRALLSSAVEQAAEAIVITRPDGYIDYVNPAFERITGVVREDAVGQEVRELFDDAQDDGVPWTALNGKMWAGAQTGRRTDGRPFQCEGTVSPVRDAAGRLVNYVGVLRDVTHERQIEAQLRQAQKMEIAGRLAGGVAHDFNNLLTVILGRAQLVRSQITADSPIHHEIELIDETAHRASALTRQLLMFSRKHVIAPEVICLNDVVANMDKMLRRLIGEDIELVISREPALAPIKVDPTQIEQVILNLVVNARDAMPLGGRLAIATRNVEIDDAWAAQNVGLAAGTYVALIVSDTGAGIDEKTKAHIFEPFFTTKGPEKGTGLGLSTVYGIVRQSDGHIEVDAEPGQGATFTIYLPPAPEAMAAGNGAMPRTGALTGRETILLAEDEEPVRDLAGEILASCGYTVLPARNGRHALEIAESHTGTIDLCLTDVVMPQMSGRELARRLSEVRPSTKLMFMSGYTDDAIVHHRIAMAGGGFIEKPFTAERLARKIREALDTTDVGAVPEN